MHVWDPNVGNILRNIAYAFANFYARSAGYLGIKLPEGGMKFYKDPSATQADNQPSNSAIVAPNSMTPEQREAFNASYQLCVASKLQRIPNNASTFDIVNITLQNNSASIQCGLSKLNTLSSISPQ